MADWASEVVAMVADSPDGVTTEHILRMLRKSAQEMGPVFEQLSAENRLRGFAGLWMSEAGYAEGRRRFLAGLQSTHAKNPSKPTVARERAVHFAGLKWAGKPLDRLMASFADEGVIQVFGTEVRKTDFRAALPARQRRLLDRVREALESQPTNPLSMRDVAERLNVPRQAIDEIHRLGVEAGELIVVDELITFTPTQLESLKDAVKRALGNKPFTPSEFREALGISRKTAIPMMEYLDTVGFTRRDEDTRLVVG